MGDRGRMSSFTRPDWLQRLTPAFARTLPRQYLALDGVVERHGSWQWTAAPAVPSDASSWLIAAVTPLLDTSAEPHALPARVSVDAWQLTADATRIRES